MTFDKETRKAISSSIERTLSKQFEMYEEEWLTDEKLTERLPMFTKEWMRRYASRLPRETVTFIDDEGNIIGDIKKKKNWMYPLHRIQRLISEGYFRGMRINNM